MIARFVTVLVLVPLALVDRDVRGGEPRRSVTVSFDPFGPRSRPMFAFATPLFLLLLRCW